MHSALIWCACHHTDCIGDVARIVKPFVNPEHLPEFFWRHLQKDIQQLAVTTGKNIDEAAVLVHLVLKDILTKEPPIGILSIQYHFNTSLFLAHFILVFSFFSSSHYLIFYEGNAISTVNSLMGKKERCEWERVFSTHYIQPVLDNLKTLNDVMELIVHNDQQGIALLFIS